MNCYKSKTSSYFLGIFTIVFIHSLCYCFSEKAPYSSFAKDATNAQQTEYYDYIIIGGGTAGCALATTLSQAAKVLLLERGGLPYNYPSINYMKGYSVTLSDFSPSSPSQPFISTDGVFNHRARVLGGGSALNAGFFSRASAEYVKKAGWDPNLVKESYEWVESKLVYRPSMTAWQTAVKNGLLETGLSPDNGFTLEHMVGSKFGGTIIDHNGRRHTTADLLEFADPAKINVHLNAVVQQILFQTNGTPKPRANGVVYKDRRGNMHKAILNNDPKNEVIVSAGAIGSPQLLMLSGIGPAKNLQNRDINVILNNPNVGQGMADNPMNILVIPSPIPLDMSLIQTVGITEFGSMIEGTSGVDQFARISNIAENFLNMGKQAGSTTRKLQTGVIGRLFAPMNMTKQHGVILEKIDGPFSSGHIELISNDANDNPLVTFNYFKDPRDLEKCVMGMKKVMAVAGSKSFSKFRYPLTPVQSYLNLVLTLPLNLRMKHITSTISMEQYCRDTVMTIWHYHGGCRVNEVVDSNYRVIGVDGLRVVDGSTFHESPGTNPQATVMMLGRYVGLRMLQERRT